MNSSRGRRFLRGVGCQAPLWFGLIRLTSAWKALASFLEAERNWKPARWREKWMDGWENVTTSEALSTATLNRQRACLEPRPYLWSSKEGWHTHTHAQPKNVDSYRKTYAWTNVGTHKFEYAFLSRVHNLCSRVETVTLNEASISTVVPSQQLCNCASKLKRCTVIMIALKVPYNSLQIWTSTCRLQWCCCLRLWPVPRSQVRVHCPAQEYLLCTSRQRQRLNHQSKTNRRSTKRSRLMLEMVK